MALSDRLRQSYNIRVYKERNKVTHITITGTTGYSVSPHRIFTIRKRNTSFKLILSILQMLDWVFEFLEKEYR